MTVLSRRCQHGVRLLFFPANKDTWKNGGDPTSGASRRLDLGRICRSLGVSSDIWKRGALAADVDVEPLTKLNEVLVKAFGPRRPTRFSAKLRLLRLIVFVCSSSDIRDRCESWIVHLSHLTMMADAELPSILKPVGVIKTRGCESMCGNVKEEASTGGVLQLRHEDIRLHHTRTLCKAWDRSAAVGLTRLLASRLEIMTE